MDGSQTYTTADLRERLNALPRVPLADLPTPLHHCPRFSAAVGGASVFIKRDDLTGLAFGGNKTRFQSLLSWISLCDAAAARLGLECYLVFQSLLSWISLCDFRGQLAHL